MNEEIARIFGEMALLLDMNEVSFKPRAFEKAALSIAEMDEDVREVYERGGMKVLLQIPDVGKGIAERIEEYIKTKRIKDYERLKKKVPVDLPGLRLVAGMGPKTILLLWKKLHIRSVKDLEAAARAGKIRAVKGLGPKTEENILKGLSFAKTNGGRFLLGEVYGLVKNVEAKLRNLPGVEQALVAGSVRRMKETVGDVDFLVVSSNPKPVMDFFVHMPWVVRVYAHGDTKSMVRLQNGMDADLRVVPRESFGAALNYFTGSKDHNVRLRQIAIQKGYKLNEYGLYKGKKQIAGKTEEDLYHALGLPYVEPEMRENTGEIERAFKDDLPKLVGYQDLKGDLQVQTDWTDGKHSIKDMAHAAAAAGLEYMVVTDHTKALAMTKGSDEKKLLRQMAEIDTVNAELKRDGLRFIVLKGAEVNILADGALDIADEVLSRLDCVGAAVHSHFKLSKKDQTERIIRAMENPHVDIIFHLTGRIIQRREPIDLDIDRIIAAAKRTGTVLEIDAYYDRLDIKDEYVRKAKQAGVKFSIDSDAHSKSHFSMLLFGIGQARRGWAEKSDIIHTMSAHELVSFLR